MKNATSPKLFKAKDENCLAKLNNLDTLLRAVIVAHPVEAIEFFTVAQLDAAALLAVAFGEKLGAYAAAEADVRSAKLSFKTTWFAKMKGHVTFLKNMLGGAITTGFPAYAGSFLELIKLVNVGKRDQGLWPTMVDDVTGMPFANTASFEPTNYPVTAKPKLNKSNGSGDLKLMKLRIGLWRIKFNVPGYMEQIIEVKIDAKDVVKMVVRMRAV